MDDVQTRNREALAAVRVRRDDLYDAVLGVERALAIPAGDAPEAWSALVVAPLSRLQEVLEEHIRQTEGPEGLFVQMREDAPQLLHAVSELEAEHGPLLEATAALADRLATVTDDAGVDAARDAALDLMRRVLTHRHRGAEVLYDAYQVDISAAD